ncbi:hypothetical protein V5N11_015409 [Cardamine amara subsp. amara]|uniref:Uncharacterized protein n=1 Tax=Cardamine amara subsp. amara TaxID=228776 RepID=A0ABD1AGK6_CARAN
MHRALLLMTLITYAASIREEEQCRDMFESFVQLIPLQPSPQYCRGVGRLNKNVFKLTSTVIKTKKKKCKGTIGKRCECPELEIVWKIRCVPCQLGPDSNITEYESHVLL